VTWDKAYLELRKLQADGFGFGPGLNFLWRTAERKFLKKVRVPRPRVPSKFDPLTQIEKLRRECEALCKAIVRRRDLDSSGWGKCVTCPCNSNHLQWGHFVPQGKSEWLRYDPRNTAMQCGTCNGPGQGMSREFARAIDRRENQEGFADMLEQEARRYKTWRADRAGLEKKRDELKKEIKGVT